MAARLEGGILNGRLLHHARHTLDIRVGALVTSILHLEDAVIAHLIIGNLDGAQNGTTELGTYLRHALHDTEGQDEVIGQHDRNDILILIQHGFSQPHGMPQAEGVFLGDRNRIDEPRRTTDLLQLVCLTPFLQGGLQFHEPLEVRQHPCLVGGGDHCQAGGPQLGGLLRDQLDAGGIDNGEQFLGNRLRGGEKARPHSRSRYHDSFDRVHMLFDRQTHGHHPTCSRLTKPRAPPEIRDIL